MSTKRSLASLDADLEEDTDLPPPAPGLRSPIADHAFDPPTLPGIVAPHRMSPVADFADDSRPEDEADLAPRLAEPTQQLAAAALHDLLQDPTPPATRRAEHLTPTPLPLPPPLPPLSGPVHAEHIDPEPTGHSELHKLPTQSTLTLPEIGQLPPLPPSPEHDSLVAGLRYSQGVFRSLRKRRRLQEQLRLSERADLDALDRVLVRLGQRVYADHLDLMAWHPLLADQGAAAEPSARTPPLDADPMRRRIEMAAARLQALAQREQVAHHKREAELESELRQRGQLLRHRNSDLLTLSRRIRGLPAGHPLYFQRQEAEIAVAQSVNEVDELAQRLGHARAERLIQTRIFTHAQPPVDQLAVALSPSLAAAQRRQPHLLVQGALLASAGIGLTPVSAQASSYAALWQRLLQIHGNLALRQTLFARLELDQQTYDRESIRRTWMALGVLALAIVCSVVLVSWVVSMR